MATVTTVLLAKCTSSTMHCNISNTEGFDCTVRSAQCFCILDKDYFNPIGKMGNKQVKDRRLGSCVGGFSLVALSLTVAPPGTPAQVLAFRIDTHHSLESSHVGDSFTWTSRMQRFQHMPVNCARQVLNKVGRKVISAISPLWGSNP